ncbi:MAG: hypothetical protein P8010_21700 [Desulfosarcinaceae bacterium]
MAEKTTPDPVKDDGFKKKPLGVLLKEKGLLTESHIQYALQEQKITKEMLGELFERLGFVTEHDVVSTLAEQSGVAHIEIDEVLPDEEILKRFNKNLCLNNVFLPLRKSENGIEVAAYNVGDEKLAQLISRQTGLRPRFFIAEKRKIINAINKFYYFLENPVEKLIANEVRILAQDTEKARGMDTFIQHLLHLAVKKRAPSSSTCSTWPSSSGPPISTSVPASWPPTSAFASMACSPR